MQVWGSGVIRMGPMVSTPAGSEGRSWRQRAARFEEARAEIRKLGLRVESEKVQAQDVTRQYVDEDANLRNLLEGVAVGGTRVSWLAEGSPWSSRGE
jgi:hypothetical protein